MKTEAPAITRIVSWFTKGLCLLGLGVCLQVALQAAIVVTGHVYDPQGQPVADVAVLCESSSTSEHRKVNTDERGQFSFSLSGAGEYVLSVSARGLKPGRTSIAVGREGRQGFDIRLSELSMQSQSVDVVADGSGRKISSPDPAERTVLPDEALSAHPGRPGAPLSIPGLPAETASGGIKAPQYFAPGVAGDHGEPIAQFFRIGTYLVPNNLSANAHGNGYSDPNVLISGTIESVQVDAGAFNVLEGNHAVDLATIYNFKSRTEPFLDAAGDARDVDIAAGWSPASPGKRLLVAVEAAYGNGLLDLPEHRQQYKLTALRQVALGNHLLTLSALGYYGKSRIPGLVPIGVPGLHDTIDPRQKDQTHSGELVLNDNWNVGADQQLQLSGFFRTYNLALFSDFGDGVIRQSEFRTVAGGEAVYVKHFTESLTVMTGFNYLRDAPRRLDLEDAQFTKVTSNNVTLGLYSPYVAVSGNVTRWIGFNLGWRRDFINVDNQDLLNPDHSFQKWARVNSPKASVTLFRAARIAPSVSFSYGQTYFTNDPRIGLGTASGTIVNRAHAYQLVVDKSIARTDFRLTLSRVTAEQSFGKIDADTGLQESEGASRNHAITLSAKRYFGFGMLQASASKADARDVTSGAPLPEAPRTILDFLCGFDRLPLKLRFRGEFEYVGAKPLGDGFVGVPVKEFRGALFRPFWKGRLDAGLNGTVATGYTGQTLETLALADGVQPFERVVGIRNPSSISASLAYRFRRIAP